MNLSVAEDNGIGGMSGMGGGLGMGGDDGPGMGSMSSMGGGPDMGGGHNRLKPMKMNNKAVNSMHGNALSAAPPLLHGKNME